MDLGHRKEAVFGKEIFLKLENLVSGCDVMGGGSEMDGPELRLLVPSSLGLAAASSGGMSPSL